MAGLTVQVRSSKKQFEVGRLWSSSFEPMAIGFEEAVRGKQQWLNFTAIVIMVVLLTQLPLVLTYGAPNSLSFEPIAIGFEEAVRGKQQWLNLTAIVIMVVLLTQLPLVLTYGAPNSLSFEPMAIGFEEAVRGKQQWLNLTDIVIMVVLLTQLPLVLTYGPRSSLSFEPMAIGFEEAVHSLWKRFEDEEVNVPFFCRGLGIIWISGPRGGPLIVGGILIYKGWTPLGSDSPEADRTFTNCWAFHAIDPSEAGRTVHDIQLNRG